MPTTQTTICQSCAMPLAQDPKGGGTNADGSLNTEYCSYCYQNGAFMDSSKTIDEFMARLEPIMANMNIPPAVVEATKATLPSLKRWKTN